MPRTPAAALAAVLILAAPAAAQAPSRAPPADTPSAPPGAQMAAPGVWYTLEIVQTGLLPADIVEKLKPLNTLPEIEAVLKANRIPFGWRVNETPSAQIPAALARQFDA